YFAKDRARGKHPAIAAAAPQPAAIPNHGQTAAVLLGQVEEADGEHVVAAMRSARAGPRELHIAIAATAVSLGLLRGAGRDIEFGRMNARERPVPDSPLGRRSLHSSSRSFWVYSRANA